MSIEINGKDNNSPKARPTTLDEIWDMKVSKYKTVDEEEYKRYLKQMNIADLNTECLRLNESPKQDRMRMEDMLIKMFRQHTNANKNSDVKVKIIPEGERAAQARRVIANLTNTALVDN